MTISIFLQSVLDGLLLSLSGFGLLGRSRGKPDRLLPLLFAGVCLLSRLGLGEQETEMAYAVLPVDHIVAFLFLFRSAVIKQPVVSKERGAYALRHACRLCAVSSAEGIQFTVPGPVRPDGACMVCLCGPDSVPFPPAGALEHRGAPVAEGEAG